MASSTTPEMDDKGGRTMSDGYGILRVQKIKKSSWGEIRGRLMHATREFQDGSRTGPETAKALANLRAMLGEVTSERSDAVGSLEIVITSTANILSLEDQKKFLADGLKWVADEFKEKNIFGTYLHDDEKVLHLHVFVCPREWKDVICKPTAKEKEEKIRRTKKVVALNAKKWTGGKKAMIGLQDKFYEAVSKKYGFLRGQPAELTNRTYQRPQLNFERQQLEKDRAQLEKLIQDKASEIVKKMTKGQLQVEAQKALINGFAKDEKSWEIFRQEVEKAIKREKGRTRTATTRSDKGR